MVRNDKIKVHNLLVDLLTKQAIVKWSDITTAVCMSVNNINWMQVRGIMQFLINEGKMVRTSDTMVEEYTSLTYREPAEVTS